MDISGSRKSLRHFEIAAMHRLAGSEQATEKGSSGSGKLAEAKA
jgi:hypothetical protein